MFYSEILSKMLKEEKYPVNKMYLHEIYIKWNKILKAIETSNGSNKEIVEMLNIFRKTIIGKKYKFNKNTHLKAGVACYDFENIVGKSQLEHSSGTNTTTDSALKYSYNSINPNIELGMKNPFGGLVPYAAVFGEYVVNPDRSKEHEGYLAGAKFGAKKVKKLHDWQFKYMYRELERDAWLDTFPDSDAMGGKTDIKGHEAILAYGLGKNTSLGFDYYYISDIGDNDKHHIFQVDWKLKF